MNREIVFQQRAWEDYLFWQSHDKKMLRRVNRIIQEISRNPFEGIGKPELLKHEKQGYWSRRIDDGNRFVYRIHNGQIQIVQCRSHYDS